MEEQYPWMTAQPRSFWRNKEHCRQYLSWLGEQLGFVSSEEFYHLSRDVVNSNFGEELLPQFQDSVAKLVMDIFNDQPWMPWKFDEQPVHLWHQSRYCRDYLEWLGKELGYTDYEDWYNIQPEDFLDNHGQELWAQNKENPYKILKEAFPHFDWNPWLFEHLPLAFLDSEQQLRSWLKWMIDGLCPEGSDDLYAVTPDDLAKADTRHWLISKPEITLEAIAKLLFPEHNWLSWKFQDCPEAFWADHENCQRYLEWLASVYQIHAAEEWYQIGRVEITEHDGTGLLRRYHNSAPLAIMSVLASFPWEPSRFKDHCHRHQRLRETLTELFGNEHCQEHYQPEKGISAIQYFLPSLGIALELLTEDYVYPVLALGGKPTLAARKQEQKQKKSFLKQTGKIFVEIPPDVIPDAVTLKQRLSSFHKQIVFREHQSIAQYQLPFNISEPS
ncbi:MAG: hypothetical protein HQM11_02710 [SAR324 cluster bacterium]|nr:hypothetical protein [SAR324 cluster bacterium]